MTAQYNDENILFLQAVNKLTKNINDLLMFRNQINIVEKEKIDVKIAAIYDKYIINNSAKQINLSFESFNNAMQAHQKFKDYKSYKHVCFYTKIKFLFLVMMQTYLCSSHLR